MKKYLLLCFTIVNYLAFSQKDTTQMRVKIYHSQKYNFDICYPDDWKEIKIEKHELLISEPNIKEGVVATTFDIQIDNDSPSLKSYVKKYKVTLNNSDIFKDVKILSEKKIIFKHNKSVELHYSAVVQQIPIEWKSIIFRYNNNNFKLTTTSLMGNLLLMINTTNDIYNSFKQ